MKRLAIPLAFLLASPAHGAEPALAVNAYVTRGQQLVVTVFSDAPTSVRIAVTLPPGWTADAPLITSVNARPVLVRTWHLTPGAAVGFGVIQVQARDGRGNIVRATAYVRGRTPTAADPQGIRRRWMPVILH